MIIAITPQTWSQTVETALLKITKAKAGSCSVVSKTGKLVGIFTDGDLRRHIEVDTNSLLKKKVSTVCTKNPVRIQSDHLAADALAILREKNIDELPVVDKKGNAVGLLDIQDLLRVGFI